MIVSFLADIQNGYLPNMSEALSPGLCCLVPNYSLNDKLRNFKEKIIVINGLIAKGLCLNLSGADQDIYHSNIRLWFLETEFHHQIQFHMFRIVDFPHFDTP
jgi:hypothetical protein